jgi:transcriptional regulator GlxA family with amidase domain
LPACATRTAHRPTCRPSGRWARAGSGPNAGCTSWPTGAPADILIVPGGRGIREPGTLRQIGEWLRRNHGRFRRVAAVCTGAYALAESGLADGRRVTTHWAHAQDLRRRYPRVKIEESALFLADGKFYSAGGVTSGIDLALDLIEQDCGSRAAMQAARELVVFLRRTGSQSQFSAPLQMQASAPDDLREVCAWAANHLDGDLSVENLASRAHLSARQFSRRFRSAFDTSPARYVQSLRLDAARAALSNPGANLDRVARTSGFSSADVLRRAFERHYQTSPGEYRRRFAPRES